MNGRKRKIQIRKHIPLSMIMIAAGVAVAAGVEIPAYKDIVRTIGGEAALHAGGWVEKLTGQVRDALILANALFLAFVAAMVVFVFYPLSRLSRATHAFARGSLTPLPRLLLAGGEIIRFRDDLAVLRETLSEREEMEEKERWSEIERYDRWAEQHFVVMSLAGGLKALSDGDLTRLLDVQFPETFEDLREDYNATVDNLNELIGAVAHNGIEIRSRTDEISASSNDLSLRTENQAATLEETAAALNVLTASVKSAADSAMQVENVVRQARGHAELSGDIVKQAVGAMSEIKRSSDEISTIIGVIDGIAFQTNLLALNAGVEAARAGEAGRGFAVVASEVRALAQRCSEAAKAINGLIKTSSEQVGAGVHLVNRTGESLTDIVDRVGQITELVSGIATGAQQQSLGLDEINSGVNQIDRVTQQNAAMAEEATAATTTLKHRTEQLERMISQFHLREQPGTANVFLFRTDRSSEAVRGVWCEFRATGT